MKDLILEYLTWKYPSYHDIEIISVLEKPGDRRKVVFRYRNEIFTKRELIGPWDILVFFNDKVDRGGLLSGITKDKR
jgi:hypothetical protein